MNDLKQGLMEKSRLAKHACEKGHRMQWKEANAVTSAESTRERYKKAAHMACITNPIGQPNLETSPIWIPLIREEVGKLQGSSL
jgi:hypothetical protein